MIALVVVAFARLMRRYEDGRSYSAAAQTEQLYIAVRTAQVMVFQEVSETLQAGAPQSDDDERSLAFLRAVAVYLLVIAVVLENIMARGEVQGAAIWQGAGFGAAMSSKKRAAQALGIPILDPG